MDRDARLAHLLSTTAVALLALPRPVVRALAGPAPDGLPALDPQARLLARLSERTATPVDLGAVEAERRTFDARSGPFAAAPPVPVAVEERTIPGPAGPLAARLYAPAPAITPAPLLVFFHGGGWVQGSLDSHDGACRMLAALSGARILAASYRLAPEHPFPAAADDARAAYAHAADHAHALGADPARIAVGGDSAGGNLAAVTALAARDDPALPAPVFQLLIYPATDLTMSQPSVRAFATGQLLTKASMDVYAGAYVPDAARRSDPRASPLFADDLAGLPPAYVATGATDPLRDEGEAYARRLREAGVPVEVDRHPLLHGFFNMTATRSGRHGVERIATALRDGLAR